MKSFQEEKRYIGHLDQLYQIRRTMLLDGRSQGVRMIEVSDGNLSFSVLIDRCLDLFQVCYRGVNMNYIAPIGLSGPQFFEQNDTNFLYNFHVGFLMTCGLGNVGPACEDDGEVMGQHGRLANMPASEVNVRGDEENGCPFVEITGQVREARLFQKNLLLKRRIRHYYGTDTITIDDTLINEAYKRQPFMLLYHYNLGYPLLSESVELSIPSHAVRGRTPKAQEDIANWQEVTPPANEYEERCYYHTISPNANGCSTVGVANSECNTRFTMTYDGFALDNFIQWKMLGAGEYVMGLEPCNSSIEGRMHARDDGTLKFLEPGQKQNYKFKLCFASYN